MEEKPQPSSDMQIPVAPKILSEHKQAYEQFFNDAPSDVFTTQELREKLHFQGIITYNKYSDNEFFVVSAKREGNKRQILRLKVCYGSFILNISALIAENSHSQFHSLETQSKSIYDGAYFFPKTTVKCFPFQQKNFENILLSVLRQVCIFKIGFALQVSPAFKNICEFDLVIFKECIEIYMEKCINFLDFSQIDFNQQKLRKLKTKLKRFHSFQIVHTDIKPDNICFSPSLDEFVFIDFGFSRFTGQQIGQKTLTIFMGTQKYFSEDMGRCLNRSQMKFVDLYYNDVHCLKKSLELIVGNMNDQQLNYQVYNKYEKQPTNQTARSIIRMMKEINTKYYIKFSYYREAINFIQNTYHVDINDAKSIYLHYDLYQSADTWQGKLQMELTVKQMDETINNLKQKGQNENEQNDIEKDIQKFIFFPDASDQRRGINKTDVMRHNLMLEELSPLRQILLNRSKIQALPIQLYFQHLVAFLNFKQPISTFKQKIAAATLTLKIFNISSINNEVVVLGYVHECLLNFFLQSNNDSFVREIPIIYSNFIILNYPLDQFFGFFTRILRKAMLLSQYLQISIRMIISTYWLIFHYYSRLQLAVLMQKLTAQIRSHLTNIIKNRILSSREQSICKQILYFIEIAQINISSDDNFMNYYPPPNINDNFNSRSMERQTWKQVCVFYYFQYVRNLISHPRKNMTYFLDFLTFVCGLQQSTIDYYHLVLLQYYKSIDCAKQFSKIYKRLQLCLGNKDLILNNMIYWQNNPFHQIFRNQNPQLLMTQKIQYLDNILIKFSGCTQREYKILTKIFFSIHPIEALKIPALREKVQSIYQLFYKLFPIKYYQELQQFLREFEQRYLLAYPNGEKVYFYQDNRIDNYVQLMQNIYHRTPYFVPAELLLSYISYCQKKIQEQGKQENCKKYYQQEINYYKIKLCQYLDQAKEYFENARSYFEIDTLNQKIKQRKIILLKRTLQKLKRVTQEVQQQLKQAMNPFVIVASKQLFDNNGFLLYSTKIITHEQYTCIIYWLLVVLHSHEESERIIYCILKYVHQYPSRKNIDMLIRFSDINFGYPHSKAKDILIYVMSSEMTGSKLQNNPYLCFLYTFLRLKQKQSQEQILGFFKILRLFIQKLHIKIQLIIRQIVLYKIVSKDLNFLQPFQKYRSQRQNFRFKSFVRRQYLKDPLHQFRDNYYPELLIKGQLTQNMCDNYYLIKLIVKLYDYGQNLSKENILDNFPNPFRKYW